ncbi:MAG: response regulator [Candidatus Omnitrophica bacterium]|nr:response regulator [Candidatus Omnitrophota bacterium]
MNSIALKNKRILIAEDDDACRYLWELTLEAIGCCFVIVKDGQEAVDQAKLNKFDIVLMDLRMPNINGYEAAAALRAIDKAVPIIALTGYARAWEDGKCQACGMNDYLTKPCTKEQLIEKLLKWTCKVNL